MLKSCKNLDPEYISFVGFLKSIFSLPSPGLLQPEGLASCSPFHWLVRNRLHLVCRHMQFFSFFPFLNCSLYYLLWTFGHDSLFTLFILNCPSSLFRDRVVFGVFFELHCHHCFLTSGFPDDPNLPIPNVTHCNQAEYLKIEQGSIFL